MILMALCIIDFIGANGLLGAVGGGGPGHSWALKWHRAKRVPCGLRSTEAGHHSEGISHSQSIPETKANGSYRLRETR